jgi:hypothetical protein
MWNKYKLTCNPEHLNEFRAARNLLRKEINKIESDYYAHKVDDVLNCHDPKGYWAIARDVYKFGCT